MTLELPFTYTSYITPHFLPHEPHFSHFSFGEQEERLRVRVCLIFSRVKRILFEFLRLFISSKFVKCENVSKYENSRFSHHFQNTKHIFNNLQTFSFIEPHEKNFFITDCKNLFSIETHEIHLGIKWDLFLHDPEWKSYHMKSMFIFSIIGRIFITRAWFWLFSHFAKFVNLRTCSTQNKMRIGNQVQNLSKCTNKLPKSFHHL